ncbi:hypothetical protein PIB30_042637 [Stylosanthes scabra]|uniref:Uncharacterized protein n=1 Tax=Stylosanthes scabra TaxID=79078 RepID=A0ABU6ZE20_9FABA|nr:hypothetical protein [Stylosanthes scabra]
MELLVTRTSASVGGIQLRLLRWNRDGEKNIFVYAVLALDIGKVARKTREKRLLDMKESDEGSNFGRQLAERGGSDFNMVWCIGIIAERRLQCYKCEIEHNNDNIKKGLKFKQRKLGAATMVAETTMMMMSTGRNPSRGIILFYVNREGKYAKSKNRGANI